MPNRWPLKIGFVTCAEHRNLSADDRVLAAVLEKRGASVVPVVWTEMAATAMGCDLLVLRSCWDYHLRPQAFLNWVTDAHEKTPVINSPSVVRWNINKRYLEEVQASGFLIPRTLFLAQGSRADFEGLMNAEELTDAVVKPAISAPAYETYRVRRQEARSFNLRFNTLLSERAMVVQEFVGEIESNGEWSLVYLAGEFSHAVNKVPQPGDFRVQHEHGGQYRAAASPKELQSAASAIVSCFSQQALYCRVDMLLREQGPTLMELELIEPLLHFELAPKAAERMAELLLSDG